MTISDPKHFHCELEVTSEDWSQAILFLGEHLPLSKSRIKSAMNAGAVWLLRGASQERLRRAKAELLPGDRVAVFYNEALIQMPLLGLELVADRTHYSLWQKPEGMMSEGDEWGDWQALDRQVWLHFERQREVLVLFALAQEVGGIVLVAHNRRAAADLSALEEAGKITRHYRLEVLGETPPSGSINEHSEYRRIDYLTALNASVLAVQSTRGTEDPLRERLAAMGHPVLGDDVYGRQDYRDHLHLKGVGLAFTCPFSGESVHFGRTDDAA